MKSRPARRVAVVSGTRAEYGLLTPILDAIEAKRGLEVQLIVTGMHLIHRFGYTVQEIEAQRRPIAARITMQQGDDNPTDQAEGLARGIAGIGHYLESAHTDMVVVLGDRIEAMAGALAAICTGRRLAHVHGGDLAPGDFDEGLRHAITKLAHLHLAATHQSARRIIRMGELPDSVHVVGAPGLDRIANFLRKKGRPAKTDTALVIQHPTGRPAFRERKTMEAILSAVHRTGLQPVIIYPNSDRGHSGIIEAIDQAERSGRSPLRIARSMPGDEFLRALLEARVLIGNSSCGMIEAASAGTPAVNVGDRQMGRQRSGKSVVDCTENPSAIYQATLKALQIRPQRLSSKCVYGDGNAGRRIADILVRWKITPGMNRKRNAY